MEAKDELMTLIQAAAQFGVTANALRVAIHRERLKATKKGRDWFVTEKAVEAWKASKSTRGRPPKTGA